MVAVKVAWLPLEQYCMDMESSPPPPRIRIRLCCIRPVNYKTSDVHFYLPFAHVCLIKINNTLIPDCITCLSNTPCIFLTSTQHLSNVVMVVLCKYILIPLQSWSAQSYFIYLVSKKRPECSNLFTNVGNSGSWMRESVSQPVSR